MPSTDLTGQEIFDVVLNAIKTQPYNPIFKDPFSDITPHGDKQQTLDEFVGGTYISNDLDDLFEHVTRRILNALNEKLNN